MKIGKWILILLGFIFCLSACLPLIDDNLGKSMNDTIAPVITITSPAAGTECANTENVRGIVTDLATVQGDKGKVTRLVYRVLASGLEGYCPVQSDGSFSFDFSTVELPGNFTLQFTATDWNQNQGTNSLFLQRKYKNSIPSFIATPGNKYIDLAWKEVPHTTDYTLYFTTDGSSPSETYGKCIPSVNQLARHANGMVAYRVEGLVNGDMHTFLLTSQPEPGWPASSSGYIKGIPLSPLTLTPQVTGGYNIINISWNPIPGANQYEVRRRELGSSTITSITRTLNVTAVEDHYPETGHKYEYTILPYDPEYPDCTNRVSSLASTVETCPFPNVPNTFNPVKLEGGKQISIIGNYAYLASEEEGFQVVDISNPENAIHVGTLPTQNFAQQLVFSAPYAYVADGYSGLEITDITNFSNPKIIRSVTSETDELFIHNVAISGFYAYVLAGKEVAGGMRLKSDLRVVDIHDPATAQISDHTVPLSGYAQKIIVSGSYAYVADEAGLEIINIQMPEKAELIRTVFITGGAASLAISGDYAYVGDNNHGVHIIDINQPEQAIDIRTVDLQVSSNACAIVIDGSLAYIGAEKAGLLIFSICDPQNLSFVKRVDIRGELNGVAITGSYALVTTYSNGLQVVNIKNPCNLALINSVSGFAWAYDVAVSGSYVYFADGDNGLWMVDISNPGSIPAPLQLTTSDAQKLVISGSYLYVSVDDVDNTKNDEIYIVDISKPAQPELIQQINLEDVQGIYDFAISGSYAYVLIYSTELKESLLIFDISEPSQPELINATMLPAQPISIAVSGLNAYIISDKSDLFVVDISAPESKQKNRVINTKRFTEGLTLTEIQISGSYAYLLSDLEDDLVSFLHIIDISHPEQIRLPEPVALLPSNEVTISGAYAYITYCIQDMDSGLQILDISNPEHATVVKKTNSTDHGWDIPEAVEVSGQYTFVTVKNWGSRNASLFIYDLLGSTPK